MSETIDQTKIEDIKITEETLEGLKDKILELTQLVEPTYNKEFWETFIQENGSEFDGYGTLLYIYWTESEVEEEKVILKLHSTNLEIRKVVTEDSEENAGKEYHEVYYVPFHQITGVSITTDYVK